MYPLKYALKQETVALFQYSSPLLSSSFLSCNCLIMPLLAYLQISFNFNGSMGFHVEFN